VSGATGTPPPSSGREKAPRLAAPFPATVIGLADPRGRAPVARRGADGELREHRSHRHRLVGLDEDLGDDAFGGGGHLGVDLVGRDVDDGLLGLDVVPHLLAPFEHRALGDRLAHLGHGDLHGGARHQGTHTLAVTEAATRHGERGMPAAPSEAGALG
jgi:hypothetical protein